MHIRRITSPNAAAAYCAKYLTKDLSAKVTWSRQFPSGVPKYEKQPVDPEAPRIRKVYWPRDAINDLDCPNYERHPGTPHYTNGICACWKFHEYHGPDPPQDDLEDQAA